MWTLSSPWRPYQTSGQSCLKEALEQPALFDGKSGNQTPWSKDSLPERVLNAFNERPDQSLRSRTSEVGPSQLGCGVAITVHPSIGKQGFVNVFRCLCALQAIKVWTGITVELKRYINCFLIKILNKIRVILFNVLKMKPSQLTTKPDNLPYKIWSILTSIVK